MSDDENRYRQFNFKNYDFTQNLQNIEKKVLHTHVIMNSSMKLHSVK